MGCNIIEHLCQVMRPGYNPSPAGNNRTYGRFAFLKSLTGFVQSLAHKVFVVEDTGCHRRISFSPKSVG
jgi:hypothetical protein